MRVLKPTSLDKCLVVSQLCPEARYVALWMVGTTPWTETAMINSEGSLIYHDESYDKWLLLENELLPDEYNDLQLFDIVEEGVKDLTRLTANETTVIKGLCRVGECTREELSASLQVSKSAVSNSLAAFKRLALMSESTYGGTGRKVKLIAPTKKALAIFADTSLEECERLVMKAKWI